MELNEFIEKMLKITYDHFRINGRVIPTFFVSPDGKMIDYVILGVSPVNLREVVAMSIKSAFEAYGNCEFFGLVLSAVVTNKTAGNNEYKILILQAISIDGDYVLKAIDRNGNDTFIKLNQVLHLKDIFDEVSSELNI
jgi:hypothetical protein